MMTVRSCPAGGPSRALFALVGALALALSTLGHATTYLQLTPVQMVDKADIAFVGTVSGVSVTVRGDRPWTDVSFDVQTPLEGVATDANGHATGPVQLSFLGGDAAGGPSLTVGGMPAFHEGERVLVLAYNQAYASPIVGFRQGLWIVTAAGVRDEDGHQLSVDGQGKLVAGGSGASLQQIVTAIRDQLSSKGNAP